MALSRCHGLYYEGMLLAKYSKRCMALWHSPSAAIVGRPYRLYTQLGATGEVGCAMADADGLTEAIREQTASWAETLQGSGTRVGFCQVAIWATKNCLVDGMEGEYLVSIDHIWPIVGIDFYQPTIGYIGLQIPGLFTMKFWRLRVRNLDVTLWSSLILFTGRFNPGKGWINNI